MLDRTACDGLNGRQARQRQRYCILCWELAVQTANLPIGGVKKAGHSVTPRVWHPAIWVVKHCALNHAHLTLTQGLTLITQRTDSIKNSPAFHEIKLFFWSVVSILDAGALHCPGVFTTRIRCMPRVLLIPWGNIKLLLHQRANYLQRWHGESELYLLCVRCLHLRFIESELCFDGLAFIDHGRWLFDARSNL